MSAIIKNIIIFIVVLILLVGGYFYFMKQNTQGPALSSATGSISSIVDTANTTAEDPVGQEFLTKLLNVTTITLNDQIFSDPAFTSLVDTTRALAPEGNEGRANPFAPIGADIATVAPAVPPTALPDSVPPLVEPTPPPQGTGGAGVPN